MERPDLQLSQDDATARCWGLNDEGQLGQGDVKNRGDLSKDGKPEPFLFFSITLGLERSVPKVTTSLETVPPRL